MKQVQASALSKLISQTPKIQLIDVRTPQEFNAGAIEGFVNVPLDDLMQGTAIEGIDLNTPIVVMCHAGSRSLIASRLIEGAGHHEVYNLTGGYISF